MKTRAELEGLFSPITPDQLDTLEAVQEAGKSHGLAGYYPDGDYSSDADWVYGIGATITALEEALGDDGGSVFDVYMAAHGEHLEVAE